MTVKDAYRTPQLVELGRVEDRTLGLDMSDPVEPTDIRYPPADM